MVIAYVEDMGVSRRASSSEEAKPSRLLAFRSRRIENSRVLAVSTVDEVVRVDNRIRFDGKTASAQRVQEKVVLLRQDRITDAN
jgi:hypothetical protein